MILLLKRAVYYGVLLIIFLFPAYLLRLKIYQIPTTFVELLIYFEFLLWLVLLFLKKEERIKVVKRLEYLIHENKMLVFGLFLLIVGAFTSSLLSLDNLLSFGLFKAYFIDPIIFFILVVGIFSYKNINTILNTFLMSGVFVALSSLFYFFSGDITYDGRLQGIFNSPNFLAMSLAPIILISVWNLFLRDAGGVIKTISLAALFILLPVFFLTYSYGAFFGLFVALFLMTATSKRSVVFKIIACLVLLLFAATVFFSQAGAKKTVALMLKDNRSSFKSREMIWSASKTILKENYILGIGSGMFQKYYLLHQKDFKEPYLEWAVPYPHNIFLAFWIQLGVLGFLGFILIVLWVFKTCFCILSCSFNKESANNKRSEAAVLISAFFVYFLLHGLLDTPYWKNDLSLVFFLFLAISFIIGGGKNKNKDKKYE
jgi:O-antigen ligase